MKVDLQHPQAAAVFGFNWVDDKTLCDKLKKN